ncbi:YggT family protein [Streptococcus downei]|uniref:Membrane protein n=1 Tax=Streptococcus downei MFe28 TaxID=764290 RepID=A0A380JI09_STRDO|nr:YggT family protein [Streptococcus downei]SUN37274.1 membrane protein [Streptococcus downei MFe28]
MSVFIILVLHNLIRILSLILVLYALISWFPGARDSDFGRLLETLVQPLVSPFRRFNLQIGGLDFTLVLVLFLLQFLDKLLFYL